MNTDRDDGLRNSRCYSGFGCLAAGSESHAAGRIAEGPEIDAAQRSRRKGQPGENLLVEHGLLLFPWGNATGVNSAGAILFRAPRRQQKDFQPPHPVL